MSSQYYRGLLASAKRDLADYQHRKNQLETIRSNYSMFDGFATELNGYCTSSSTNSSSGIVILGGFNDTYSVFGKQDGGSGDDNLSSSRGYINSEIQRVQNKIDELERKIRSYTSMIQQEEQRERRAKEAAKKEKKS